jgi:hypothetical protein
MAGVPAATGRVPMAGKSTNDRVSVVPDFEASLYLCVSIVL